MAAQPVSIHRKKDLRNARVFAEHLRLKLKAPASAVTDRVVERLADMLQEHRDWLRNEAAQCRAEMAALRAEIDAEFARIRALIDAVKAFVDARKALVDARKALDEALAVHGRDPTAGA
jgi:hypothetical protein